MHSGSDSNFVFKTRISEQNSNLQRLRESKRISKSFQQKKGMADADPKNCTACYSDSPILEQPNRHFNSSLSAVKKWKYAVQVKAKVSINSQCAGGTQMYKGSADAIIIRRVDILKVHDYARQNCDLRDYLLIRLPLKIGLRTGEICTLRIEDLNFDDHSFRVLDSKRKQVYPLPLDPITLDLLKNLNGIRLEGYVFTHKFDSSYKYQKQNAPLTVSTVWCRVRSIAEEAGVKEFNPRQLRRYFAAKWMLDGGNLEVLRRILRHRDLGYTQFYESRLIFQEDVDNEYSRIQDGPFVGNVKPSPFQQGVTEPLLNQVCAECEKLSVCKLADRMPVWVTGCRFQSTKNEMVGNVKQTF